MRVTSILTEKTEAKRRDDSAGEYNKEPRPLYQHRKNPYIAISVWGMRPGPHPRKTRSE